MKEQEGSASPTHSPSASSSPSSSLRAPSVASLGVLPRSGGASRSHTHPSSSPPYSNAVEEEEAEEEEENQVREESGNEGAEEEQQFSPALISWKAKRNHTDKESKEMPLILKCPMCGCSAKEERKIIEEEHKNIALQRKAIEAFEQRMRRFEASSTSKVKLNVGGKVFVTSLTTLTKQRSMLSAMFSDKFNIQPDENGEYFIDRNPKHFDVILDYLRKGTIIITGLSQRDLQEIRDEVDFYQLHGLRDLLFITRWSTIQKSEKIVLSNDNRTARNTGSCSVVTVEDWVTRGIYEWHVSLDKCTFVGIGLVSDHFSNCEAEFHNVDGCCVYYKNRCFYHNYGGHGSLHASESFNSGDVVTVRLDLELEDQVSFEKEGRCFCSVSCKGYSKLKLACILYGNSQVSLISYAGSRV
ncbi:BTB/POZ domain-containing protein [Balamuthia mandrillaris]